MLRSRTPVAPSEQCKIRYRALVEALPAPFANLHWRDPRLNEALGELVSACRASGLPAISAIVVNDTGYPGNSYYPVAHPGIEDEELRMIARQNEIDRVAGQIYAPLTANGEIP